MILFRVATVYHLFTTINLKLTQFQDKECALILTGDTDFSIFLGNLKKANLFDKIICSKMTKNFLKFENKSEYKCIQNGERLKSVLENYGAQSELDFIDSIGNIEDYYIFLEYFYERLLYYYMVHNGFTPKVHIVEEGTASYVRDCAYSMTHDNLLHQRFEQKSYLNNIVEYLLYEPKLYAAPLPKEPINCLPKIKKENKTIYQAIFGAFTLPKEKFIVLESAQFADRASISEMDAIKKIVAMLGEENVAVKPHPRSTGMQFELNNISVVQQHGIPLEMAFWDEKINEKIFISELSTSTLSPFIMFDTPVYSVNTFNLVWCGRNYLITRPTFKRFYEKICGFCNKEHKYVFSPTSYNEFLEITTYILGRMALAHGE